MDDYHRSSTRVQECCKSQCYEPSPSQHHFYGYYVYHPQMVGLLLGLPHSRCFLLFLNIYFDWVDDWKLVELFSHHVPMKSRWNPHDIQIIVLLLYSHSIPTTVYPHYIPTISPYFPARSQISHDLSDDFPMIFSDDFPINFPIFFPWISPCLGPFCDATYLRKVPAR